MLKYVLKRIKIVRMKNRIEKLDKSKNTLMKSVYSQCNVFHVFLILLF